MRQIVKGSTTISVDVYIIDSTDGTPETGVVFDTSGIDLEYRRDGEVAVNITEADLITPALTDAWADGGFLAIGHGLYRLDVPDAAFATGAGESTVSIQGTVTGMIVLPQTIQLIEGFVVAGTDGVPDVNLTHIIDGAVPAQNVTGVLEVDVTHFVGEVAPAPAVTGVPDVNMTHHVDVAASVTNSELDVNVGQIIGTAPSLDTGDLEVHVVGMDANTITASALATDAAEEIADKVWDEDATGHQTGGTFGQAIGDPGADADTIYGSVVTGAAGANIAVDIIAIKDETALIVDDTDLIDDGTSGLAKIATDVAAVLVDTADMQPRVVAIEVDTGTTLDGRIPSALVSGRMSSDVVAVSGDTTAADNLELQYDTTGLTGGKFPANQDQVGAIGTAGGAALSFEAADDNVDGALNSVTFVGVETSGTFVSTEAEDGTNHVIDDDTNVIDILYQFNIGGGRTGTTVIWKGYLAGSSDSVNIQLYDFVGTDWETRAVITGKNQAVNETIDFPILAKHTGTGVNIGIVYVRFITATATNPTLETDELIVEAVGIGQTVGYQTGAIWIDTVNGTAGTENFVNGTADNPVKSIADANTLAASLKLNRFIVSPGSSITFAAAQESQTFLGLNWTLALGGQSISDSHISGADVSGTGTASTEVHFDHCEMGDCTLGACHIDASDLEGDLTLSAASNYFILGCHHTSATVPLIDFGSGVGNTEVHIHNYHGALQISNMGQTGTDTLHFTSPDGKLTLNSNNIAGGTANINGVFDLVNNAPNMTVNKDGAIVSTVGALGDTAAAGDPTSTDTLVGYIKQLINVLVGTTGVGTWAAGAAPGNGVSISEALRAVFDDTNSLDGTKIPDTLSLVNINAEVDTAFTTIMVDSVPADGTIPTREQAIYMVVQFLTEFAISGTTRTTKKVDGSTTLMTNTLDDDTLPTSLTRAT